MPRSTNWTHIVCNWQITCEKLLFIPIWWKKSHREEHYMRCHWPTWNECNARIVYYYYFSCKFSFNTVNQFDRSEMNVCMFPIGFLFKWHSIKPMTLPCENVWMKSGCKLDEFPRMPTYFEELQLKIIDYTSIIFTFSGTFIKFSSIFHPLFIRTFAHEQLADFNILKRLIWLRIDSNHIKSESTESIPSQLTL